MVWGRSLPGASAGEATAGDPWPVVSPARVLAGLALVGTVTWTLESVAGLGPNVIVVLVAALGVAAAVSYGRAGRRLAVVTLLVIAMSGLGWIELINKVQYGTLALTGAPPLVRWCGTTYRPSGIVTTGPTTGTGPAYSEILRTPSGYDVFGVALHRQRSCGTSGPLFVDVGEARYAAYDAVTASSTPTRR